MLLAIVIWFTIFLVLYTWGHLTFSVYQKMCKPLSTENYNATELLLLGMCSILIPLQTLTFFLPTNQFTLLVFVVLSIGYWCFNYKQLKIYRDNILTTWASFTLAQRALFVVLLFLILICPLTYAVSYDAEYYHFQHIKWMETYPIIPGLANLEDRFGFNSNYLLLSSLFSFSFVKGELYTMLQIVLYIFIWIEFIVMLFKSKYDLKNIATVFLLSVMYFLNFNNFRTSSTDIVPILVVCYILMKIALNPDILNKKPLFFVVALVSLLTFKISISFLCLICLFPLFALVKNKAYKSLIFICGVSLLIFSLWLVRNVILTGYLVYPLHQIDLFSFDWKMASGVLQMQQVHIKAWAIQMLKSPFIQLYYPTFLRANFLIAFFSLLTPIIFLLKRKTMNKQLLAVAVISYFSMLVGLINAPDVRFANGFIFGILAIAMIALINGFSLKIKPVYQILIYVSVLFIYIYPYSYFFEYYIPVRSSIVFTPQSCTQVPDIECDLKIGSTTFKILRPTDEDVRPFYTLYTFLGDGVPFGPFEGRKLQSINTLEMRGESITDGLRTKSSYIDEINNNVDGYITRYYFLHYGIIKENK